MPANSARRVWFDLLIGPGVVVFAMLLSLLVPVRSYAQVNMTLGQLIPDLIRNTSQTVSASSAGLQVAEAGSVGIRSGSSLIGSVAINELRVIPLARIAARAVTGVAPVALAMLAVDLIGYGIKHCAQSVSGWCGPVASPNAGDQGFNGYVWAVADSGLSGQVFASAEAGCRAAAALYQSQSPGWTYTYGGVSFSGNLGNCSITGHDPGGRTYDASVQVQRGGTCVAGYVLSGGKCVVDPEAPPQPYTYPQLSDKLAQVLSGNPDRAKDYWGVMSPADWYAELRQPTTQAKPAQVVSPADGKVSGPTTSTQTPSGTTTQQTSCTVSPNSDSSSLANKPVQVACSTTTTNPDGTTSTSTTTTTPTTSDGTNPGPRASSATPCGLGTNGSPKCLIDETGTPTKTDATTAMASPASDLQTAEQTAETQLQNVNKNRSWTLTMPHILPGGTCEPIEWFSWGTWRGSWDVCTQLQYVHDLLAWLWPVLSAVYVWNKAAGANAGAV